MKHIKVLYADICYIKAGADYSEVFTEEVKFLTTNSLKYWTEKLDSTSFCQVHKSYIVNIHFVQKVAGNQIFLTNDVIIPIGRSL